MQTTSIPPAIPSLLLYDYPSCKSIYRITLTLLLMLLAGNTLLWGSSPGIGTGLFLFILGSSFFVTRIDLLKNPRITFSWILLTLGCIGFGISPQWESFFSASLLILFISGNMNTLVSTGTFSSIKNGGINLLFAPERWLWLTRHFNRIFPATGAFGIGGRKLLQYTFQIFLPAFLICGVFGLLLASSNVIMGSLLSQIMKTLADWLSLIEFPSVPRILFSIGLLTLSLGLLWPKIIHQTHSTHPDSETSCGQSKGDRIVALRYIVILLGVNLLYFTANTIDGLYLWLHQTVPEGINHSQFVHHGTYNLIVTVILAALLITFVSAKNRMATSPAIKDLSLLWIAQNLFLVSSVGLRVYLYIASYQWTLLRFYLIIFLLIVFLGFLWLSARVLFQKNLVWLVGKNVLTVFAMIYLLQFFNTKGFIASKNVNDYLDHQSAGFEKALDIYYLANLGPAAFPALISLSTHTPVHQEEIKRLIAQSLKKSRHDNWQSYHWSGNHNSSLAEKYLNGGI